MMKVAKYSGCGNVFILCDNRLNEFPPNGASELCSTYSTDGAIFLENSQSADFRMRIFNCDGSEAEMCGNGLRCLIKFLVDLGIQQESYSIETGAGNLTATISPQNRITIEMPKPDEWRSVSIEGLMYHHVNVGVPHAVHFVNQIDEVDVQTVGSKIRFAPAFAPKGANVSFAEVRQNEIYLRTYERGVERETQACGTGAQAAAYAAAQLFQLKTPLRVKVRSGDLLEVSLNPFTLTGSAEQIENSIEGKSLNKVN